MTDLKSDMKEARSGRIRVMRPSAARLIVSVFFGLAISGPPQGFTGAVQAQAISQTSSIVEPIRRPGYAGDQSCLPCHQKKVTSYQHTSHHLTSALPGPNSILGSFNEGKNVLLIQNPTSTDVDPRLFFRMESESDGYYETAIAEMGSRKITRSERIDIVTGSGVRGQTYLYWKSNELFELPVSYWTDGNQWINSPGYTDGTANFSRHVNARCLECHASYIRSLSTDPQSNVFDRSSLVVGIECETCHGPGEAHVETRTQGVDGEAQTAE